MSFLKYIHSKPQHVRRQYAFWFSVSITGFIALIWITTLPARFASVNVSIDTHTDKGVRGVLSDTKEQMANTIATQFQGLTSSKSNTETTYMDMLTEDVVDNTETTLDSNDFFPKNNAVEMNENPLISTTTSVTNTSNEQDASTTVTDLVPPPKIILIGTTTIQRSE